MTTEETTRRLAQCLDDRTWATLTPAHFAHHVDPSWQLFEHLVELNRLLMEVAAGRVKRLLISMPPQHGKSLFVSRYFLAWMLGHFPSKRVILTSYEADYAKTWGRKVRDTLEAVGEELFGIRVSSRTRAAHQWEIEGHGGGMSTAGMGGAITGKTADLAVIDDPIKNSEQAASPTIRKQHKDWYGTTLLTRVSKDAAIIVIQTRWHMDDLSGWLRAMEKEPGADQWTKLTLPAISLHQDEVPRGFTEAWPDPIGREPGESLCPQLHPLTKLQQHRAAMGEAWFWALYQGWPVPTEGGMFNPEWWKFWDLSDLPCAYDVTNGCWFYHGDKRFDEILQSWDMSFRATDESSYVVGQVWGRIGPRRYLLDQIRERLDLPGSIRAVKLLSDRWPFVLKKLVEDKANGPAVVRALQSELDGLVLVTPEGPKELRAAAWSPRAEAGDVFIPARTYYAWVKDWIDEHSAFPRGANDDQVDAGSQANDYMGRDKTPAPAGGFIDPPPAQRPGHGSMAAERKSRWQT